MKRLLTASHGPEDKGHMKLWNNLQRKVIKRGKEKSFCTKLLRETQCYGMLQGLKSKQIEESSANGGQGLLNTICHVNLPEIPKSKFYKKQSLYELYNAFFP